MPRAALTLTNATVATHRVNSLDEGSLRAAFAQGGWIGFGLSGTVTLTNTITITNHASANLTGGAAVLAITSVKLGGNNPGDFPSTTNCIGNNLSSGSSCTITVTLDPTANGGRSATITIVDNAPNSPQVITLSGVGGSATAPPTITSLSPASATAGGPGDTGELERVIVNRSTQDRPAVTRVVLGSVPRAGSYLPWEQINPAAHVAGGELEEWR